MFGFEESWNRWLCGRVVQLVWLAMRPGRAGSPDAPAPMLCLVRRSRSVVRRLVGIERQPVGPASQSRGAPLIQPTWSNGPGPRGRAWTVYHAV